MCTDFSAWKTCFRKPPKTSDIFFQKPKKKFWLKGHATMAAFLNELIFHFERDDNGVPKGNDILL